MAEKHDKRLVQRVVTLRKRPLSWRNIAEALAEAKNPVEVSPSTVRRMYDQAMGAEAHFDSRPLPGGRWRKPVEDKPKGTTEKRTQRKTTVKAKKATPGARANARTAKRSLAAEKSMAIVEAAQAEEARENGSKPAPKASARKGAATKAVKANA
jgi:hypothetical protein